MWKLSKYKIQADVWNNIKIPEFPPWRKMPAATPRSLTTSKRRVLLQLAAFSAGPPSIPWPPRGKSKTPPCLSCITNQSQSINNLTILNWCPKTRVPRCANSTFSWGLKTWNIFSRTNANLEKFYTNTINKTFWRNFWKWLSTMGLLI